MLLAFQAEHIRALSCICGIFIVLSHSPVASAAVSLTSNSTTWNAVNPGNYDPSLDYSAQNSADIVGTSDDPGFFTLYDTSDDHIAFRVRMNDSNSAGSDFYFGSELWVGIDTGFGTAPGGIDAFLNYSDDKFGFEVNIYSAGLGDNVSPATTTVPKDPSYTFDSTTNSNYGDYSAVTALDGVGATADIGGDSNDDWYVSFQLPFATLQTFLLEDQNITIDENTPLRFIVFTSTQANSFNQDLGGAGATFGDEELWTSGPLSDPFNSTGLVPEPSSGMLLMLGSLGLLLRRRRQA